MTKFHFNSTLDSKEISVALNNVTDFKICGFHKNPKIEISQEQKIYQLDIKGYFITENSFAPKVIFKHNKVKKVTDPGFEKKVQMGSEGSKSSKNEAYHQRIQRGFGSAQLVWDPKSLSQINKAKLNVSYN